MSKLNELMLSATDTIRLENSSSEPIDESLEEGELYVVRKGQLEHLPRNEDDGMRRIRITEDAFQIATEIGRSMRRTLNGYEPDVSLITSALVLSYTEERQKGQDTVKAFVLKLFQQS